MAGEVIPPLRFTSSPRSTGSYNAKNAPESGDSGAFWATFTSRLLDRGVSVAVAARLLGDLPETLIRHYARSTEGIEREAIKELEA